MKYSLTVWTVLVSAVGCASSRQATYHTPDIAVESLVAAVRTDNTERLREIFGSGGDEMIGSGDPVADRNDRQRFLDAYTQKHALVEGENGSMILMVGRNDWPFPAPIVRDGKMWRFDTEAGKDEIINRRIGRNELYTIEVCREIVEAQREYLAMDPDGDGLNEYARKFLSDPGTRNGLYWPTTADQPSSPLGELAAQAAAEGYAPATAPTASASLSPPTPRPFHGYYYRMLTSQGPHAPGGAFDYLIGGRMIGGFAVIAYPAQYNNSGVMSFMVNQSGTVYQSDLGPDTTTIARAMTAFDPGPGWTKVE